jgi:hypothetical protein
VFLVNKKKLYAVTVNTNKIVSVFKSGMARRFREFFQSLVIDFVNIYTT